jgi:hypothetical protein
VRRLIGGLFAFVLMTVTLLAGPPAAPAVMRIPDANGAVGSSASSSRTQVSLYGDSLAFQAQPSFGRRMAARAPGLVATAAFPMTALCDYRSAIVADLLRHQPWTLVLEFSGNAMTPCMRDAAGRRLDIGSTDWRDRYVEDLRAVMKVANRTDTTVVWATAPPVDQGAAPVDYPRQLAAAVRALAVNEPRLHIADTGAALTERARTFAMTLPCRADEGAVCINGRVTARAADGLHFDCHGVTGPMGLMDRCRGYSAGARRYGEAMADAALAR